MQEGGTFFERSEKKRCRPLTGRSSSAEDNGVYSIQKKVACDVGLGITARKIRHESGSSRSSQRETSAEDKTSSTPEAPTRFQGEDSDWVPSWGTRLPAGKCRSDLSPRHLRPSSKEKNGRGQPDEFLHEELSLRKKTCEGYLKPGETLSGPMLIGRTWSLDGERLKGVGESKKRLATLISKAAYRSEPKELPSLPVRGDSHAGP